MGNSSSSSSSSTASKEKELAGDILVGVDEVERKIVSENPVSLTVYVRCFNQTSNGKLQFKCNIIVTTTENTTTKDIINHCVEKLGIKSSKVKRLCHNSTELNVEKIESDSVYRLIFENNYDNQHLNKESFEIKQEEKSIVSDPLSLPEWGLHVSDLADSKLNVGTSRKTSANHHFVEIKSVDVADQQMCGNVPKSEIVQRLQEMEISQEKISRVLLEKFQNLPDAIMYSQTINDAKSSNFFDLEAKSTPALEIPDIIAYLVDKNYSLVDAARIGDVIAEAELVFHNYEDVKNFAELIFCQGLPKERDKIPMDNITAKKPAEKSLPIIEIADRLRGMGFQEDIIAVVTELKSYAYLDEAVGKCLEFSQTAIDDELVWKTLEELNYPETILIKLFDKHKFKSMKEAIIWANEQLIEEFPSVLQHTSAKAQVPVEQPHPDWLCPIAFDLMVDPVVCADGQSFERQAIEDWLRDHDTNPITNLPLQHKFLIPNYALKSTIEAYKLRNNIV